MRRGVNAILQRWESLRADGPAIYAPSGEVLRTWADMDAEASEFAGRLLASTGPVGIQCPNHEAFPAMLLGCWRAGRAVCLFDPELRDPARGEIEAELGIGVRASVADGSLRLDATGAADRAAGPSAPVLYKLTYGTASRPQAVGFSADQILADCEQVCRGMGIGSSDINFGAIAFFHSYGLGNLVTPLICLGVRLVVSSDPMPRAIECGLARTGATVLPAVPAMFRGLLAVDSLPATLRLCVSAGAPLDPVLADAFRQRFGRKIHSFYGASECGGICYDASEDRVSEPGFVGCPLDGVSVELDGESRTIRIRSRAVGSGAGISGGVFQPGDLIERVGAGFRIIGRTDDLINVAGKKVDPCEVERAILSAPGTRGAVVCAADDPARGQEICALVAGEGTRESLRRHCRTLLADWKIPRRFVFVPEIPSKSKGKISRADIAAGYFPGSGRSGQLLK
jgi:long-chain acyl-CoA synthetase